MIEKLFSVLPDWAKSKLLVRIVYTISSFMTARIIGFLTGDYLNAIAGKFVAAAGHIGVVLQFKVVSIDQRTLEAFITGVLMIAAEFLINHLHENTVLPAIQATASSTEGAPK